jgi:hypothetical protein
MTKARDGNWLDSDTSRIGYLFDGIEDTPPIPAQLSKTERSISVEIPWNFDTPAEYQRWFGGMYRWSDDPGQTGHRYAPPRAMDFVDHKGSVVLVGCSDVGHRENMSAGVGTGSLSVDFAMVGALGGTKYLQINGLRSEIEGLGAWIGLRSLQSESTFTDDGRLKSISLNLQSPDPLRISRSLNLTVRPSYRYGPGEHPDETTITERMLVETLVSSPREWEPHLALHTKVRDLIRLSAWHEFNFQGHEATRDDNPHRALDGTNHGRAWYPVETFRTRVAPPSRRPEQMRFLFSFDDIGIRGVSRWLKLRQHMSRGITPILRLLELNDASIETHFAQLGIGLEALGFSLARDSGVSAKKAGQESFEERLRRLALDHALPFPIDEESWIRDMRRLYNSVKHANRPLPDSQELVAAYWKSLLVVRCWIAGRLGLRPKQYEFNRHWDRMARNVQ